MKIYYMEFEAKGITLAETGVYDNPQAVIDEANHRKFEILDNLSGRSDELEFDSYYEDDAPENEGGVLAFKDWMRQATEAIPALEESEIQSITDEDIEIHFQCKEVKDRFVPPVPEQEVSHGHSVPT